ncbi:hypothetical protein PInf_019909 [Phytophthora infestans]|nr:hypothetical protein PInf_019909 [Phytophthora infestans]
MDSESSSDSLPPVQILHTALPIGREYRERRHKNRRKRRSSGDDVMVSRRDDSSDEEKEDEEQEEQEEMITISAAELEKWQQRVLIHRIAEFGRVHGTIMQEARQYVNNTEMQLRHQFEEERASLRAQAEEYVAKAVADKESWRQKAEDLQQQVEKLHKQVDKLEVDYDALKMEKAKNSQETREERQGNREHTCTQQTHSPPNNQTQVQPGGGKVDENLDKQATNGHGANGYEPASLHPPLVDKTIPGEPSGIANPIDVGLQGQDQKLQQPCASTTPVNRTLLDPGVVTRDGLQTVTSESSNSDIRVKRSR